MIKLKHKQSLVVVFSLLFSLLAGVGISLFAAADVNAEPPGCYRVATSGDPNRPGQTGTVYESTNCPGEGYARAVSQFNACFVGTSERDCHNLNEPGNQVPESQTISGSGNDGTLESDCDTVDYENCEIIRYVVIFINILTAMAGIIIVIMLVYSGIRYTAARDNPQEVAAARRHIFNALLALAFLLGAFALLQYLVPGGVFSS